MMAMAHYAITGGSGRIGRAIHRLLTERHTVTGLDRSPSSAVSVIADLLNDDALLEAFDGAEAVFHTAALHAPHVGVAPDEEFHRINVEGTERAIRAAQQAVVKTFVFTSTTALYGRASQEEGRAAWITEETTPAPRTIYHRTKIEAETLARECASRDFRVRVIRMSRCFPEPAPLMAAYRLHRGVDARDVAAAHVAALGGDGPSFTVYNISGSAPFERVDCEELKADAPSVIRRRMPELAALFEQRGWPLPASIDRVYDSAKAHDALNWTPAYDFREVVRQLDRRSSEVLPPNAAAPQTPE